MIKATAEAEPGWGQRIAALALLILLGGVFYLVVDQGLLVRYRYYRDSLEQQQHRLAQMGRLVASREPIQQQIDKIRHDQAIISQYLPQPAPALAAAELQPVSYTHLDVYKRQTHSFFPKARRVFIMLRRRRRPQRGRPRPLKRLSTVEELLLVSCRACWRGAMDVDA